jgi:hypothetical protein
VFEYGGGGSGYIETVVIDISSTEYEVTVGRDSSKGNSFVTNKDGKMIANALQGGNGGGYDAGPGYSGGGGQQAGKGESNGSDGQGEQGGRGSGIIISENNFDHESCFE